MPLLISLTSRCNMRCPHCFFSRQSPACFDSEDIAFDDAIAIADYYHHLGVEQAVPNAVGEVLLHPRYQDIARLFGERFAKRPWLVTNGLLLAEYADFVTKELCEVMVSVDGPDAGSFAAFRGRTDDHHAFARVIAGLEAVVALKKARGTSIAIFINYVVTADRCEEMPAMIRFAAGLEVDGIRFTNFHPTGGADPPRPLHRDNRQVAEVLKEVLGRSDYPLDIYLPNLLGMARPPFFCRMLSGIVVGPKGDYAPCCRITPGSQWGNFFDGGERHNNSSLRRFRQSFIQARCREELPAPCQSCGYLCQNRPVFLRRHRRWTHSSAF